MLPPQVQDHERTRGQLNAALTAMNMASEGQRLPPVYAAPAPQPAAAAAQPPLPPDDPLAGSRWASGASLALQRQCTNTSAPGPAPGASLRSHLTDLELCQCFLLDSSCQIVLHGCS